MSSPNPEVPPSPTGLRAQFHHLLPRHALFQVRIHIHQLASVPLVQGQFAVKWKFKNTHKVKGKSKSKGPGPEPDGDGDSFGSGDTNPEASPPSPLYPLSLGAPSRSQSALDSGIFDGDDEQDATSTRGQTPWLPLRDHSVSWDQALSAVVQMSIDRDTQRLLPHPFKLKVVQRVIAGDLDAPHNPQLGVVELNLAEYVDSVPLSIGSVPSKGVVTRRYLLSDSKTNATLRLSIRVEPTGASTPFTAPPLPEGEILAGVSSFLSIHEDVYRTRPRALDLYAPVEPPVPPSPHRKPPFDIRALPLAYGPRPTESLIDALFNPAPVHDERLVSPFTRLVPVPDGSDSFLSASYSYSTSSGTSFLSESTSSADTASVYSAHDSSLVPSSSGASLSPGSAEGRAHRWWQRNNRDRSRSRSRSRASSVAVA